MIKEQFVGFETAKLLERAGFDVPCNGIYHVTRDGFNALYIHHLKLGLADLTYSMSDMFRDMYLAPTQAVAARWLREVYNLHVYAIQTNLPLTEPQTTHWEWGYIVTKVDDPNTPDKLFDINYTAYEDAMEAGIRRAIESVIDKQEK